MNPTFLTIGAGIAGLNFALNASKYGKVIIFSKSALNVSSTYLAQGGIAAPMEALEPLQNHITDTLKAGHYHNKTEAVQYVVEKAENAIHELQNLGVRFEEKNGKLSFTKEGGYKKPRIAHSGDSTGRAIMYALTDAVQQTENIEIIQNCFIKDLIIEKDTCIGVEACIDGKITEIFAPYTMLATGGIGKIYKKTSNAPISTGDGIAIAHRAGAKLADMEFVQFHPTALDKEQNNEAYLLLTEALRGEGAIIINEDGKRFLTDILEDGELAPRDSVTLHVYNERKEKNVYLTFKDTEKTWVEERFPFLSKKLQEFGLQLHKDNIPITPVAHYLCGGVKTDLHGRTSIKNLFAAGEVTYTGVHGANRLASNGLLEAMVFSAAPLQTINEQPTMNKQQQTNNNDIIESKHEQEIKKIRIKLQECMWEHVGILRSTSGLIEAEKCIKELQKELTTLQENSILWFETNNMLMVAELITKAAQKRKKTLGSHIMSS